MLGDTSFARMKRRFLEREESGELIRVGLVGAGAMGMAIAYQVSMTPGMVLSWVCDLDPGVARKAAEFDERTGRFNGGCF